MGIEFPEEFLKKMGVKPTKQEDRSESFRVIRDNSGGRGGSSRPSNNRDGGNRDVGNRDGSRQTSSRGGNRGGYRDRQPALPHATAPYNFVSLPEDILPSPLGKYEAMRAAMDSGKQEKIQAAYRSYLEEGKTEEEKTIDGYIELKMKTLSPIFIGGNGSHPFAPVDPKNPVIPGSSIRGMVKNLLKIITLGAMRPGEDFHNRHLYYRCIMAQTSAPQWQKDLHAAYKDRMTDDGGSSKTKPGFLIKTKKGYAICPLHPDRYPERVLIREYEQQSGVQIDRNMRDVRVEWDISNDSAVAYAISGCKSEDQGELFETKQAYLDHLTEIARVAETDPDAAAEMRRNIGKQFVRKYNLADADFRLKARINISRDAMKEYEDDKNRRGVNLLRERKKEPGKKGDTAGAIRWSKVRRFAKNAPNDIELIAPCFYLPDGKQGVVAFGHGQSFRIPYRHSIGDLVPEPLKKDTVDFADALFGAMREEKRSGKKALWSSRVFFEDARPEGNVSYEEPHSAHPMSSPNPTSFQLYLAQQDSQPMKNWDSEGAQLRGYKLYWHIPEKKRNGEIAWQASDDEVSAIDRDRSGRLKPDNKRLTAEIAPIKTGACFKARIRFSRLRKEELGALLMVFDMDGNKNLAYKLGKGKSIGLGSFRITSASLFVNDRESFGDLFADDGGWNDPCVPEDASQYLEAFKQHVKDEGFETAWQHTMGEAARMLDWDANTALPGWERETQEMRTKFEPKRNGGWRAIFNKDFQNRKVLLSAEDVVTHAKETRP